MHAASAPARLARAHHRFDLRTLTHVGLDATNGGIIRNLTHAGIAVQAVSPPRAGDQIRVRFELRHPRLRIETRGEVIWTTPTGQCGIRFLDRSPGTTRQINEWIFGNLLESARHWTRAGSIFGENPLESARTNDGLMISQEPTTVIPFEPQQFEPQTSSADLLRDMSPLPDYPAHDVPEQDWLSRPFSGRNLARTIDGLVIVASLLLVSLVFLSIAHEFPRWPLNIEAGIGAVIFVLVFYWGFFQAFGGSSLGARLARLVDEDHEEESANTESFR